MDTNVASIAPTRRYVSSVVGYQNCDVVNANASHYAVIVMDKIKFNGAAIRLLSLSDTDDNR